MITRLVKLTLKQERASEFVELYTQAQEKIKLFDGCIQLQLYTDAVFPNIFFTQSVWQSTHHLEAYRQSVFFNEVWAKVKPMFALRAEAWTLNETA